MATSTPDLSTNRQRQHRAWSGGTPVGIDSVWASSANTATDGSMVIPGEYLEVVATRRNA